MHAKTRPSSRRLATCRERRSSTSPGRCSISDVREPQDGVPGGAELAVPARVDAPLPAAGCAQARRPRRRGCGPASGSRPPPPRTPCSRAAPASRAPAPGTRLRARSACRRSPRGAARAPSRARPGSGARSRAPSRPASPHAEPLVERRLVHHVRELMRGQHVTEVDEHPRDRRHRNPAVDHDVERVERRVSGARSRRSGSGVAGRARAGRRRPARGAPEARRRQMAHHRAVARREQRGRHTAPPATARPGRTSTRPGTGGPGRRARRDGSRHCASGPPARSSAVVVSPNRAGGAEEIVPVGTVSSAPPDPRSAR